MVDQVAGLVANVVVVVVLAGHDDLARLLGELLEQAVLLALEKLCRIGLLRRGVATAVDDGGQPLEGRR